MSLGELLVSPVEARTPTLSIEVTLGDESVKEINCGEGKIKIYLESINKNNVVGCSLHAAEYVEGDYEMVTAILFEDVSYINDSEEGCSVVLGFPRTFMRNPIPLQFNEIPERNDFLKLVHDKFDTTIIVITKDDMRVSLYNNDRTRMLIR